MQKRDHPLKLRQGRTLLDDVCHGYKLVPLYCAVYKAEKEEERGTGEQRSILIGRQNNDILFFVCSKLNLTVYFKEKSNSLWT